MSFAPVQAAAVAVTAAAIAYADTRKSWVSLLIAFGMSHYLVSLVYSRRQVVQVMTRASSWLPVATLLALGWYCYTERFPLVLYFGIHHVFNETYLKARAYPVLRDADSLGRPLGWLILFHACAYLVIVDARRYDEVVIALLVAGSLMAFLAHLRFLLAQRPPAREWAGLLGLEVLLLVLIPVSFFYRVTFEQFVFYHFALWLLMPISSMLRQGGVRGLAVYAALSGVTLFGFYLMTPMGPPDYHYSYPDYFNQFIFWSYFHITVSFFLSRSHPRWINRWFEPQPRVRSQSA